MHMGGMKFKQRGREEQAEADGTDVSWHIFLHKAILIEDTLKKRKKIIWYDKNHLF